MTRSGEILWTFAENDHKIGYLENIGKSDINELEIAIADPKNAAILNAKTANDFIKKVSLVMA